MAFYKENAAILRRTFQVGGRAGGGGSVRVKGKEGPGTNGSRGGGQTLPTWPP